MELNNQKNAFDALKRIQVILAEFGNIPSSAGNKSSRDIEISNKKYSDPFKILRKIERIIISPTPENATRKLKSLLGFLNSTLRREK